jgi:uncharacterized protein YfdQ (DUF2303 family)
MSETTTLEATASDGVAAIIDQAQRAAAPHPIRPGELFMVIANGGTEIVDADRLAARPRRKAGRPIFYTAESFGRYVAEHRVPGTAIYANVQGPGVVALIDGHVPMADAGDEPGWGEHRPALALRHTPEWMRWAGQDNVMLDQQAFAEHLELGQGEIVDPPAASMVELAKTFEANTKVQFREAVVLESGERKLLFDQTISAKAGEKGDITIPREFTVGVAPYEGTDRFRVVCRLRYRIEEGRLRIGYSMVRPEAVLEEAFRDIVTEIEALTELRAFAGTPSG